jgi:hypothetical protein
LFRSLIWCLLKQRKGSTKTKAEKMPWLPDDAPHHTHKADTPYLCRLWSEVANSILADTGDEAYAIRGANAAVARARRQPRATESGQAPYSRGGGG